MILVITSVQMPSTLGTASLMWFGKQSMTTHTTMTQTEVNESNTILKNVFSCTPKISPIKYTIRLLKDIIHVYCYEETQK